MRFPSLFVVGGFLDQLHDETVPVWLVPLENQLLPVWPLAEYGWRYSGGWCQKWLLEVGDENFLSGRVLFKSLEQEVPFLNPSSQKFYTSLGITSCSVSTMQALSSPPFLFKIWELFSRSLRSHLVKASVEMSFLQPALPRTLHHLGNSQPQVCARAGLQAWVCQGKTSQQLHFSSGWIVSVSFLITDGSITSQ